VSAPFEVRGAKELAQLSKALKDAGQTGMRKELTAGMSRAARPLLAVAKQAAQDTFPKQGGLADRERKVSFRVSVRTGAKTAGVRIVAPGRYVAAGAVNRTGRFRHPVFADSRKTRRDWTWTTQTVPGGQGWFDRAMNDSAPVVRRELEQAMENVLDKIVREARRG
jgi:hypothetical protein